MEANAFQAYLRETADRVDEALAAYLQGRPDVPPLKEGVTYALGLDRPERKGRGKRLRPVLCLLTCEGLGGDPARAMPVAAASEMLHNFFLVHDDIEDRDVMRRGRESVWVRYGEEHGINIGDYMLALTYDLLLGSTDRGLSPEQVLRIVTLFTRTLERTGEGQAIEMRNRRRRDLTTDDYLHVVTLKTGHYLAAPLVAGALVAEAPPAVTETLTALGQKAGPIFQIADDLLDLTSGKGREARGSDVREGKRSYLVVAVAAACDPAERERLFDILDTPRPDTRPEDIDWVVELFERYDVISQAKAQGRALLTEARALLETLPAPVDRSLQTGLEFMLERKI